MLSKHKFLAMAVVAVMAAMLALAACGGDGDDEDKATITFGDLNWASALLQNRIAQYIVEHGYGYPTDVKFGATLPLFEGLQRGDTDVTMEIWLPNQDEAWDKARSEGRSPVRGPEPGFRLAVLLRDSGLPAGGIP